MATLDFNSGPDKILADRFEAQVLNGLHHLKIVSGGTEHLFLFGLDGSKKLSKLLGMQVKEMEEKNGVTFDDRLNEEPMPSPLSQDFGDSSQNKPKGKK